MDVITEQFLMLCFHILHFSSGSSDGGIFGGVASSDADEEILSSTQQGNIYCLFILLVSKKKMKGR